MTVQIDPQAWMSPGSTPLAADLPAPRRPALTALSITLWLGVLTQKIALPGNIEITLPIMAIAITYLLATGRARIGLPRLLLFASLVLAIAVCQLLAADHRDISPSAVAMALGAYAPFLVLVPLEPAERMILLRRFQALALFIAAMVAIQWACQLARLGMPSLEAIVPRTLLFQSYNYVQALQWRAAYMKPNGLFMLEASLASQILAMAVVIEICLFRRWGRVAALLVAQLSTFGGTGFTLLLVSLLVAVPFYLRGRSLAILVGLFLLVAAGTSFTPVWTNFASRSGELGADDTSSGRGRFVEPYLFMVDRLSSNSRTLVSGLGPGNGKLDTDRTGQLVMSPVVKATVEYGLVAGMMWMLFLHLCVLRTAMPFVAAFVTLIQYDVLNGALLVPLNLLYCWILAAAHPADGRDRREALP